MQRVPLDLVAGKVQHVHDAPVGTERQEAIVHRHARRRVALQDIDHVGAQAMVLELGLLFLLVVVIVLVALGLAAIVLVVILGGMKLLLLLLLLLEREALVVAARE